MRKPDLIGIYGNVHLPKRWCDKCGGYAFVIQGELQCCGSGILDFEPKAYKRESSPEITRVQPHGAMKQLILKQQNNTCFYCERMFGSRVRIKWKTLRIGGHQRETTARFFYKAVTLRLNWDHLVPWSYSQNNNTDNFVAACNYCNRWKGAIVFRDVAEAQIFLLHEWSKRLYVEPGNFDGA